MRQGPSWSVPEVSVSEQSVPINADLGKMSVRWESCINSRGTAENCKREGGTQ